MPDPTSLSGLIRPEYGWIITVIYLWVEIRSPWGRVESLLKDIGKVVTVVRAFARVLEDDVAVEKVDRYLVEDGNEPGDFIHTREGRQIGSLFNRNEDNTKDNNS